jgi:predicted RNase H-like HicB family nuclease
MTHGLDHYLKLRYPMEIIEDEEGGYFGHFPDLPGCVAQGESVDEVVRDLNEAKHSWIEACRDSGMEVPMPHEPADEYSGKFLLRIPKSLHRELAVRARRDGMSLNQYVGHLLSLAVGRERQVDRDYQLLQKLSSVSAFSSWGSFRMLTSSTPICPLAEADVVTAATEENMPTLDTFILGGQGAEAPRRRHVMTKSKLRPSAEGEPDLEVTNLTWE